jgi:Leucine-rich repeat (LRR) protein
MKKIKPYSILFSIIIGVFIQSNSIIAQVDSSTSGKEYFSLEEALKQAGKVKRLNLSNQQIQIPDTVWSKFTNLEYLSLKNDHLKKIPVGICNLKNLKVLDLSGNDFNVLPSSFSKLKNLQELYLNEDKFFRIEKSIPILRELPNLRTLHLENDNLMFLPKNLFTLNQIESLYLNNNQFKQFPTELRKFKKLKFVDLHSNKLKIPMTDIQMQNYGIKIRF